MMEAGITSYMDACVKPYLYKLYNDKYMEKGTVIPRALLSIAFTNDLLNRLKAGDKSLSEVTGIHGSERLFVNTVKFFMDGVMEDKTGLIHNHYCCTDHHGLQPFNEKELKSHACYLHKRGIQCHIHAVGDAAIKLALDSFD